MPNITSQQLREMIEERGSDGFSANTIPQIEEAAKQDNQFNSRLQSAMDAGISREQALNYFAYGDVQGDRSKKESFFERSKRGVMDGVNAIQQRGVNLNEQLGRIAGEDGSLGVKDIPEVALGVAGQTYGGAVDLALNTGLGLASAITPDAIEDPIVDGFTSMIQGLVSTDTVQKGIESVQDFTEENPRAAFNIGSVVEPLVDTLPIGAAIKGGKAAGKAGKKAVQETGEALVKSVDNVSLPTASDGGLVGRLNRGVQRALENRKEMKKLSTEARDVVKSGIEIDKVQDMISSSADDISAYRYMLDIAENNQGKLAPTKLPKEVAGRSALKPVRHLVEQNKEAITRQAKVVAELPDNPTNLAPVKNALDELFELRGIQVKSDGSLRNVGGLPDGDMKMYKLLRDQLNTNAKGELIRTPSKTHAIRQRLFSEANLAKARLETFSDAATRDIEKIRGLLAEHGGFPDEYMELNTQMARTIPVLQQVSRTMGHKGGLDDLLTRELKAGEIARRLLGNASSRPLELIRDVVDLAEETGFKMTDDILKQVGFSELLEETIGITQKSGLAGGIEKGTNAALELGSAKGVLRGASKAVDVVTGRSTEEKIRALKKLLQRLDTP